MAEDGESASPAAGPTSSGDGQGGEAGERGARGEAEHPRVRWIAREAPGWSISAALLSASRGFIICPCESVPDASCPTLLPSRTLSLTLNHAHHAVKLTHTRVSESASVKLKSKHEEVFEVEKDVAFRSVTVKNMIEDTGLDTPVPLPMVDSKILIKVIEYCKYHHKAEQESLPEDEKTNWDKDFVKVASACCLLVDALTGPRNSVRSSGVFCTYLLHVLTANVTLFKRARVHKCHVQLR